ncbi:hypothetical protein AQJ46_30070 [Streptomyces canus]|uniref:DUF304 domain-containing protein n=1 Tax=Streptomyces canus TaxID=58343 RepID=A0A117R0U1_9ACTN|nr:MULTISPECIES: hypothetical protein [Streptomyces]KUN64680.1 hypothetical protein AQJ46_30070 [Streptomyces canus]MDI5909812.1 hypothetical protein [Streptomyces sp. 12257]
MELSPSTLNRLANSALGAIPAAVGVAYATQADGGYSRLVAWAAVIGFAFIAVRGYRLGVTCDNRKATIRGYLRTRVIVREHITAVSDFPAFRWTTRTGRKRWTPITAFMASPSETAGSRLSKERITAKLRRWARH